jgi:hypothetical protein
MVHFGDLPVGMRQSRKIALRALDDKVFRIEAVDDVPSVVSADYEVKDSFRQFVTLTLIPSEPGELECPVVIHTTHAHSPSVTVLVKCRAQ